MRGIPRIGDAVPLVVLRDGKEEELSATLARAVDPLIPNHIHDHAPSYLIKGGLVFQELSRPYLEAFGKEWQSRAPLNLLDALTAPEDYEEGRRRLVFLSRVVPTPATIGYDTVANQIVSEVNGKPIKDMASLVRAFADPVDGLHEIRIDDVPYVLYLEPRLSEMVDQRLLQSGLPLLERITE